MTQIVGSFSRLASPDLASWPSMNSASPFVVATHTTLRSSSVKSVSDGIFSGSQSICASRAGQEIGKSKVLDKDVLPPLLVRNLGRIL